MTEFFLAFWLFFLSMLLSPNAKCANTSEKSSTDFWISLELLSADFRKGCISTALCHQPAFKLAQVMTLDGQTAMMSWPLLGGADSLLQKENPRLFVAHWTLGDVEDVAISCQIAGTDPSFGFARVCDETPARRLFQEQMVRQTVMKGARMAEETPLFNQRNGGERGGEGDELLVQMRGRCFNATLAVRKHVSRCPWCPDPNLDIQVVGGTAGPGQQSEQSQRGEALELHNALILALSGAVVFSLTGLCCVLCAHWRYRRRNNNGNRASKQRGAALIIGSSGSGKHTKKRILKQLVSQPRAQRSLPISPLGGGAHRQQQEQREFTALYGQHQQQQRPQQQGGPEEQRYDIPWDNKFCLVPRQWLVGSSQQPSVCDDASLAFSGGIEPLGRSGTRVGGEYATCAEFRAITSPAPGGGCGNNSMACRPPPPPPPPLPFMHRQSQPQLMPIHAQQQQQTFSPNTSGSSFGRQDDSGLDSV